MKKPVRRTNPFASLDPDKERPALPRVSSARSRALELAARALRRGLLEPDASPDALIDGFVATAGAGPLVRASVPCHDAALDAALCRAFAGPVQRDGWLRLVREQLVHGTFSSDGWLGAVLYFDDLDLGVITRWRVGGAGQVVGEAFVARFRARVLAFPPPARKADGGRR